VRAFFAALGMALAVTAAAAAAHASLVASSPQAGEQLERAPATITLTFDEPVTVAPQGVRVLDARGANVAVSGPFRPGSDKGVVAVRTAELPIGRYVVAWQVVSADSHIVSGAYAFGVGEAAGAVPANVLQRQVPGAAAILAALHFALLAGIIIGAGWFAGSLLVARAGAAVAPSMLAFAAWSVIGLVAFAQIFVQSDVSGLSLGATIATRYGLLRLALIAAAMLGFRAFLVTRGRAALLAAASAVAILAEVFSGHAATGVLPAVGVLADTFHLLGATVWIGVLLVTLAAPERVDVRRTSNVAAICVAAIVVSAVPQALRSIPSFATLVSTEYGLLVCAKIGLLLLTLAFAFASRRRVAGGAGAVAGSVRLEVAVLTVLLGVTAVLVDAAPPRSIAAATIAQTSFAAGDLLVRVQTNDDGGLVRSFRIVTMRVGVPANADGVQATISDARTGSGPLDVPVHPENTGAYTGETTLPFPGTWSLFVSVRSGAFDEGHTALGL
jgi:copper transport protein